MNEALERARRERLRPVPVPCPGLAGAFVGVRAVPEGRLAEIQVEALTWTRERGLGPAAHTRAVVRRVLAEALVDGESIDEARPAPLFDVTDVALLDEHIVDALLAAYVEHTGALATRRGPHVT